MNEMSQILPTFAILVLLAAVALWLLARRGRRREGLPAGVVVYADTGVWQRNERPLYSQRYRLSGKPDYLVRDGRNIVPVEVKSGAAPDTPYLSHVMQLAADCL